MVRPWTPVYNTPKMLRALKGPFQRGGGVVVRAPRRKINYIKKGKWRKRGGNITGPISRLIHPKLPAWYKKGRRPRRRRS